MLEIVRFILLLNIIYNALGVLQEEEQRAREELQQRHQALLEEHERLLQVSIRAYTCTYKHSMCHLYIRISQYTFITNANMRRSTRGCCSKRPLTWPLSFRCSRGPPRAKGRCSRGPPRAKGSCRPVPSRRPEARCTLRRPKHPPRSLYPMNLLSFFCGFYLRFFCEGCCRI